MLCEGDNFNRTIAVMMRTFAGTHVRLKISFRVFGLESRSRLTDI